MGPGYISDHPVSCNSDMVQSSSQPHGLNERGAMGRHSQGLTQSPSKSMDFNPCFQWTSVACSNWNHYGC